MDVINNKIFYIYYNHIFIEPVFKTQQGEDT